MRHVTTNTEKKDPLELFQFVVPLVFHVATLFVRCGSLTLFVNCIIYGFIFKISLAALLILTTSFIFSCVLLFTFLLRPQVRKTLKRNIKCHRDTNKCKVCAYNNYNDRKELCYKETRTLTVYILYIINKGPKLSAAPVTQSG